MIYDIIQELNQENGSNHKMDVLRKHSDNDLLKRVLKMTYDRVNYTYGITLRNVDHPGFERESSYQRSLEEALDVLENQFATRELTGYAAIDVLGDLLYCLSIPDRHVIHGVVNRDLRINMGRSNINKIFKGLIVKPVYMRCGLYNEKTAKKINPKGAFVQLKADGTYREATVEGGKVLFNSRSGEVYEYPVHSEALASYPDGHYIGELTVVRDGKVLDRATGNGLINSDNPPHEEIMFDLWDYVTLKEYTDAANKIKGTTPYHKRLQDLDEIVNSNGYSCIKVIESHEVDSISEALQHCSRWMREGLEGAILKDRDAIFRDGTSPQQLKLKLELNADVRITGFKPGNVGTKREGRIGSIEFATDDGKVKGYASGFSDAELDNMDSKRDEFLGKIMTVSFNDLSKARGNEFYALSHPRFEEIRTDKTETDTLERIFETKEMAVTMGSK